MQLLVIQFKSKIFHIVFTQVLILYELKTQYYKISKILKFSYLTLNPLTWKIWWAPNNASRWQMGFNSAFKGLK